MKQFLSVASVLTSCLILNYAAQAEVGSLTVTSPDIVSNAPINKKFAFCTPDGAGKTTSSENISPQISWSGAPAETKSFALVVVDPDVPSVFDDANKEGKTIAEDFPRKDFYHWVLVNIPVNVTQIAQGKGKDAATGKAMVNDFAAFMKDKPAQTFLGYDGPCPPFNDVRLHHYHFTVYALDTAAISLDNTKSPATKDMVNEIQKHAIAKGELVGTYSNFVK